MYDLLDEGLVVLDNLGVIVHSNQAFAESLQYSTGDLLDYRFDDLVADEQKGVFSPHLIADASRSIQLTLMSRDGERLGKKVKALGLIEDELPKGFFLIITDSEEVHPDFEKIISGAHLKMVTIDRDLNITYVNPAFSETAGKIIGTPVLMGVESQFREEFRLKLEKVMREGTNQQMEFSETLEGRRTTWHELRIGAIRDGPDIVGAVIAGYEITDRVLAMRALGESEGKFRGVFEHANDGIILADEEGRIIAINAAQEKFFGINREDVIGLPLWEVQASILSENKQTSEHQMYLQEALSSFFKMGTAPWLEKTIHGKFTHPHDGTQKTFSQTAFRIPSTKGFMLCSFTWDTTEQTRLEEERKASEHRYKALFDENNDGVFILSLSGKFLEVNARASELLGYDRPEDLVDLPFSETIVEGERAESIKQFERIMGGAKVPIFERTLLKRDGTHVLAELSVSLVLDRDGNPQHVQTIVRDITERKVTQAALDESRERYELALQGADLGVWDWNAEADEMIFSKRWAEMLGYSIEEIEPNYAGWEKLVHPEDLKLMEERWNSHVDGITPFYSSEHRMRTKTGGWKWVLERGKVVEWNEKGGTRRATGTLLDITERKVIEKALEQSEQKYRNLLENIPQRVFYKNRESIYVACNPAFARDLEKVPTEIIGKTDFDLYPMELAESFRTTDKEVLENLQTWESDQEYITSGEPRIAHIVKAPVRDDEGTIVGILGIFWDITENTLSAQALRASETKYRNLVEQSLMGIAIVPRGFESIAFVNPTLCNLLGYSEEEILAMSPEQVSALVHKDDVVLIDDYLNNRLQDKQPGEALQVRMIHNDGSEIWVDFSAGAIEYGETQAVQVTVVDITKRIEAELEVLRDRQVFRTIAEGAIQAKDTGELSQEILKGLVSSLEFDFGTFRLYDEKTNTLRYSALFGVEISDTRPELPVTQEFSEEYIIVRTALTKIPEFISDIEVEIGDKPYLNRLKKFNAASVVAYPILDDANDLLGILSLVTRTQRTFTDGDREIFSAIVNMLGSVLERKKAEKALQISERRYRELLRNISEGMAIIDLDEKILFVNKAFAEMLDYTQSELVGMNILDIIAEEDKELILDQTKIRREGVSSSYTHRFVRKDGEHRIVRASAVPSRDDDGQVDGTIAVVTDITERIQKDREIKKLNEELAQRVEERTAELAAANKELEAFSYSVSHDLRAPLRTIDGFSQALLEDYSDSIDDTGHDFLRRVRSAATHMGSLIEDLLVLSRVTRTEMERVDVDLSLIASEIIGDLQEIDPDRQVHIRISDEVHVRCDQRLIKLVLQNLLDNAWKFTSKIPDALIEFGCQDQDGESVFYVRDNGAGFNMDYSDKLFVPFQRLHQAEEFEGSGIGLATVQRIINRHGGRVWAESVIDGGSTFYFTIPERRSKE
ncbi:MAG: PAS domain S-box protein [Candidatus Thorarchaeota archaeon]